MRRINPKPASLLKVWLTLGGVSSLPTVWANVMTGLALASTTSTSPLSTAVLLLSVLAISMAYLGGMLLNDVFDAEFDAAKRNNRPIAKKQIGIKSVTFAAILLLLGSLAATVSATFASGQAISPALFSALAFIGSIVLYHAWHKTNPISPVIMGACRALVYITCAMIVSSTLTGSVLIAAAMLWLYVIGLTYTVKQEHLTKIKHAWPLLGLLIPFLWAVKIAWGNPLAIVPLVVLAVSLGSAVFLVYRQAPSDIPKAAVTLIAGMALWDAVLLLASGLPTLGLAALACWVLTLALQLRISET